MTLKLGKDFRLILTRDKKDKTDCVQLCYFDIGNWETAGIETINQYLALFPLNTAEDHAQAEVAIFGSGADRSQDISANL